MALIENIVIVGPTASGKTDLAIEIAERHNAEIICADSRTIYKEMNIGTAKPTQLQQNMVKHHCINLVSPNEPFTVADFVKAARAAEHSILNKNKRIVTVGGSGLFVDAYVYEYSFTAPNRDVREQYSDETIESLHKIILQKGLQLPTNNKNKRHLLHVLEREGQPAPTRKPLPSSTLYVGISPPKLLLHKRIQQRAQQMLKSGVLREVADLYHRYGDQPAFHGGAYGVLRQYINSSKNDSTLAEALVRSDISLAKRQLTWFRRNSDIVWFNDTQSAYAWLDSNSRVH